MKKILVLILCLFSIKAYALGIRSTANCGPDYFKYCSQYPVGSNEVRDCFKRNGHNLSSACVDALLAEGEVTKEEVDGEREKIKEEEQKKQEQAAPNPTPQPEPIKSEPTPKVNQEPEKVITKTEVPPEESKVVKSSTPSEVKSSIFTYIAKRVAAKLKEPVVKEKVIIVEEEIIIPKDIGRKVQRGGKWDGFPLYLEWNDGGKREYGNELTMYGYEDRK